MTQQNNLNKNTKNIIGTDGREKIAFYKTTQPAIFQRSLSTVLIEYISNGNIIHGSGFAVGSGNCILTNYHVIGDETTLLKATIKFNNYSQNLTTSDIQPVNVKGQSIYVKGNSTIDFYDDYCLFSIDDFDYKYVDIKRLFGGLFFSSDDVTAKTEIYQPQYPKGLDARVAVVQDKGGTTNCTVIGESPIDKYGRVISISCDSELDLLDLLL